MTYEVTINTETSEIIDIVDISNIKKIVVEDISDIKGKVYNKSQDGFVAVFAKPLDEELSPNK